LPIKGLIGNGLNWQLHKTVIRFSYFFCVIGKGVSIAL
jgi:hypothetical protein